MDMHRLVLGLGGMVAGLAMVCGGPLGCSDDDGEDAAATTTTGVTTPVDGTVVTNVVAVPAAEAPSVAEDEEDAALAPAVLNVAGEWNGVLQTTGAGGGASGHLDLDLDQNGGAVSGQFFLDAGAMDVIGSVSGTLVGDHLKLLLDSNQFRVQSYWLDGHVNAGSTDYSGTWTTEGVATGTFAVQK